MPSFKEPDIIFLQVGSNEFPRTVWNQRDADAFSLQLLKLDSPLNDRYKAKRVVVDCIVPRFSTRRSRRSLSPLELRQYSMWAQALNTKFTIQESRRGLFNYDGAHLSTQGQYLLHKIPAGNDCCLPFPAVSCTQQALTVAISSGSLYEYVWSLDITK